jgi:hypothetical protein
MPRTLLCRLRGGVRSTPELTGVQLVGREVTRGVISWLSRASSARSSSVGVVRGAGRSSELPLTSVRTVSLLVTRGSSRVG